MSLPFYKILIPGLHWSATTLIGVLASTFTTVSLIPQLIKLYKEKRKGELSLTMLLILLGGCTLWTLYGFLRKDFIIMSSNLLSLLLNIALLAMLYHYRKR